MGNTANNGLDFSDLGGQPISPQPSASTQTPVSSSGIDFSDLGGKPIVPATPDQPGILNRVWDATKQWGADAVAPVVAVAKSAVTPPQDHKEELALTVGGYGALQAYRASKAVVDGLENTIKVPGKNYQQAKADFQRGVQDLQNKDYRNLVSDAASTSADIAGAVSPGMAQVTDRARELSEGARPGGDLVTPVTKTALDAGSILLPEAAGEALGKGAATVGDATAEKIYQSTLKPPPSTGTPAAIKAIVQTGLENEIPVTEAGVEKLNGLVSDLHDKTMAQIKAGSDAGATVNKYDVASRLGSTANQFTTQVNPEADLNAVAESGNEFLRNQPEEISALDAQKLKTGTYKQLGDKAYGELSSATEEAQKALARGIKEELQAQFPVIGPNNAKEGDLLDLRNVLQRAVNRTSNRNILSLTGGILAGGATAAATGSELGAAGAGMGTAALYQVMAHPWVQSELAITIHRLSKGAVSLGNAAGRVAKYTAALSKAAQPLDENQQ